MAVEDEEGAAVGLEAAAGADVEEGLEAGRWPAGAEDEGAARAGGTAG